MIGDAASILAAVFSFVAAALSLYQWHQERKERDRAHRD